MRQAYLTDVPGVHVLQWVRTARAEARRIDVHFLRVVEPGRLPLGAIVPWADGYGSEAFERAMASNTRVCAVVTHVDTPLGPRSRIVWLALE